MHSRRAAGRQELTDSRQQQTDRGQCYTWAVQQSGFDPAFAQKRAHRVADSVTEGWAEEGFMAAGTMAEKAPAWAVVNYLPVVLWSGLRLPRAT